MNRNEKKALRKAERKKRKEMIFRAIREEQIDRARRASLWFLQEEKLVKRTTNFDRKGLDSAAM